MQRFSEKDQAHPGWARLPFGLVGTASTRAPLWQWKVAAMERWRPRWPWTPRSLQPREASRSSTCAIWSPKNMMWVAFATWLVQKKLGKWYVNLFKFSRFEEVLKIGLRDGTFFFIFLDMPLQDMIFLDAVGNPAKNTHRHSTNVYKADCCDRQTFHFGGNGILAGLVSITAGCGNMECGSAFATGFVGALIYQAASMLLQKLKIDAWHVGLRWSPSSKLPKALAKGA